MEGTTPALPHPGCGIAGFQAVWKGSWAVLELAGAVIGGSWVVIGRYWIDPKVFIVVSVNMCVFVVRGREDAFV